MKNYFVYITTNPNKTVFYTGITNDLQRRMFERFENRGKQDTFAGKYYCYKLIFWELHFEPKIAIEREKEIKNFTRQKKLELIKMTNPNLHFLKI